MKVRVIPDSAPAARETTVAAPEALVDHAVSPSAATPSPAERVEPHLSAAEPAPDGDAGRYLPTGVDIATEMRGPTPSAPLVQAEPDEQVASEAALAAAPSLPDTPPPAISITPPAAPATKVAKGWLARFKRDKPEKVAQAAEKVGRPKFPFGKKKAPSAPVGGESVATPAGTPGEAGPTPTQAPAKPPRKKALLGASVTATTLAAAGAGYVLWPPSVEAIAKMTPDKRAILGAQCDAELPELAAPLRAKLTRVHQTVAATLVGPLNQPAYAAAREAVRVAELEAAPELSYTCRNYREFKRLDAERTEKAALTAAAPTWAGALKTANEAKTAHDALVAEFAKLTTPMAFNTRINELLAGVQKGAALADLQSQAAFGVTSSQQIASFFKYGGGITEVRQSEIYPPEPEAKAQFVVLARCDGAALKPLLECAATSKPAIAEVREIIPAKRLSVWLRSKHGWKVNGVARPTGVGILAVDLSATPNTTSRAVDWDLAVPTAIQYKPKDEEAKPDVAGRSDVKFF